MAQKGSEVLRFHGPSPWPDQSSPGRRTVDETPEGCFDDCQVAVPAFIWAMWQMGWEDERKSTYPVGDLLLR